MLVAVALLTLADVMLLTVVICKTETDVMVVPALV